MIETRQKTLHAKFQVDRTNQILIQGQSSLCLIYKLCAWTPNKPNCAIQTDNHARKQ